ncbi:hypothetical protein BDQ12DRAFT_521800 [Crucibulum laeve]|uniref:Uncharacterized protein n=1 Tax=Crucibulum laeve TaxID=68775 RepID=A0A5C3LGQ3_9AGAR|nr:hypothetical protein BDQ12DRAFT_521800 [Crucibulum laeve]
MADLNSSHSSFSKAAPTSSKPPGSSTSPEPIELTSTSSPALHPVRGASTDSSISASISTFSSTSSHSFLESNHSPTHSSSSSNHQSRSGSQSDGIPVGVSVASPRIDDWISNFPESLLTDDFKKEISENKDPKHSKAPDQDRRDSSNPFVRESIFSSAPESVFSFAPESIYTSSSATVRPASTIVGNDHSTAPLDNGPPVVIITKRELPSSSNKARRPGAQSVYSGSTHQSSPALIDTRRRTGLGPGGGHAPGFTYDHSEKSEKGRQNSYDEDHEQDDFDPYSTFNPSLPTPSPSSSRGHSLAQLEHVLGPDVPHTTEIDTFPCAGVRLAHGPLAGLVAWRLVVRLPSGEKDKFPVVESLSTGYKGLRDAANGGEGGGDGYRKAQNYSYSVGGGGYARSMVEARHRTHHHHHHHVPILNRLHRNGDDASLNQEKPEDGNEDEKTLDGVSMFDDGYSLRKRSMSSSSSDFDEKEKDREMREFGETRYDHSSAPSPNEKVRTTYNENDKTPLAYSPVSTHAGPHMQGPRQDPQAITTNFILDTSQPYSLISWEVLLALGYKPSTVDNHAKRRSAFAPSGSASTSNLSGTSPPRESRKGKGAGMQTGQAVILRVQGVPVRFLVAKEGEASRLGVQFMHDAGVSFYLDRESGMPVLFGDTALNIKDVPRTVRVKMSIQQRVRSMFGIRKPS